MLTPMAPSPTVSPMPVPEYDAMPVRDSPYVTFAESKDDGDSEGRRPRGATLMPLSLLDLSPSRSHSASVASSQYLTPTTESLAFRYLNAPTPSTGRPERDLLLASPRRTKESTLPVPYRLTSHRDSIALWAAKASQFIKKGTKSGDAMRLNLSGWMQRAAVVVEDHHAFNMRFSEECQRDHVHIHTNRGTLEVLSA